MTNPRCQRLKAENYVKKAKVSTKVESMKLQVSSQQEGMIPQLLTLGTSLVKL